MNKTIKKLILIMSLMIAVILGTSYISTAEIVKNPKNEMYKRLSPASATTGVITYDDLCAIGRLLCNERGGHLRNASSSKMVQPFSSNHFDPHPGETEVELGAGKANKELAEKIKEGPVESASDYTPGGLKDASPYEAYVLVFAGDYGGTEYTPVQLAWWASYHSTLSGNATSWEELSFSAPDLGESVNPESGKVSGGKDLAYNASAFEDYIKLISDPPGSWKIDKTETDVGGEKMPQKFKVKYEPKWIEKESDLPNNINKDPSKGDVASPTVELLSEDVENIGDKGDIIVGPFAISYISKIGTSDVKFSYMTGMEIYTDASGENPIPSKDWSFVWLAANDGGRVSGENSEMPLPYEKFFIRLKKGSIGEATKITNIKTQFKYMNGYGKYQDVIGTYGLQNWDFEVSRKYKDTEYDDEGNVVGTSDAWTKYGKSKPDDTTHHKYTYYTGDDDYKYKVVYTGETTGLHSQNLVYAAEAALWYEYVDLDRKLEYEEGSFEVTKKVEDSEGRDVSKFIDKQVTFEATVRGALNGGKETLYVKPGESTKSQIYYWLKGSKPKLTLEEIDSQGMEVISVGGTPGKKYEGTLNEGIISLNLLGINRIGQHEAKITIRKYIDIEDIEDIIDGILENIEPEKQQEVRQKVYDYLKSAEFEFKVNITGKAFSYDGKPYDSDNPFSDIFKIEGFNTEIKDETGKIIGFEGSVETKTIKWSTEEAPSYFIEEKTKDGFKELVSENSKGTFSSTSEEPENYDVVVIADNEIERYEGYLEIKKRVNITQSIIEDLRGEIPEIEALVRNDNFKLEEYMDVAALKKQKFTFNMKTENILGEATEAYVTKEEPVTLENGNIIKEGNDYIGEWTKTITKKWFFGEKIHYTIEEKEGSGYELIGFTGENGATPIDDGKKVTGIFEQGDNGGITAKVIAENKLKFKKLSGGLTITKKVVITDSDEEEDLKKLQEEELLNKDYTFDVFIKGPFFYKGTPYPEGEYKFVNTMRNADGSIAREDAPEGEVGKLVLLPDGEYRVLKKEDCKENDVVVIRLEDDEREHTITIDDIWWYNKFQDVPTYTVEETNVNDNVLSAVNPTEGDISRDANGNLHQVIATNSILYYRAKLQVHKSVLNEEALTEEDLNREFKVGILINYHNSRGTEYNEYILKRRSDELVWEIDTNNLPIYSWGKNDAAPTYEIIEPEGNNNFVFVGGDRTGALKANTEQDVELQVSEASVINKKITGGIKVSKVVVDSKGNIISPEEPFGFNIAISSDNYSESIKANETWTPNKIYTWGKGENPPTFTVEEINIPAGYKFKSIKIDGVVVSDDPNNPIAKGSLEEDQTINIVCINEIDSPKTGHIEITKTVVNENNRVVDVGETFTFSGTTSLGPLVDENGNPLTELKAGQTWKSKTYTWTGDAPTYTITEEPPLPAGYDFVSLSADHKPYTVTGQTISGSFSEDGNGVSISAINKIITEHFGTIKIKKQVSGEYDPNETFTFTGEVSGTKLGNEYLVDDKGNGPSIKVGEEWISKTYTWTGEAPTFTITEDEHNGYEFVTFIDDNNSGDLKIDKENRTVTGVLKDQNETGVSVTAVNDGPKHHYEANLKITKIVMNTALKDQTFLYDIKLYSEKGIKFAFKDKPDEKYTEYTLENFEIAMENNKEVTKKIFDNNIIWYSEGSIKYTITEHPKVKDYKDGESPEFKCTQTENVTGVLEKNVFKGDVLQDGGEFKIGKAAKYINDLTNPLQGQLVLTKQIEGDGVSNNDDFEFIITVIEKGDESTKKTEKVSIKANETWPSNIYEWGPNEAAPKFIIEEKLPGESDGWEFVKVESNNVAKEEVDKNKITVVLKNGKTQKEVTDSGNVDPGNVVYTNKYKEHFGTFKLTKNIIYPDKILTVKDQTFVFDITISGEFKFEGETELRKQYTYRKEIVVNKIQQKKLTELESGTNLYTGTASIISDKIIWYGNNAPTVHVTEVSLKEGDPEKYKKLSEDEKKIADLWVLDSITNNGASLIDGEQIESIIVSNKLPEYPEIKFVIKFAGNVWEDVLSNPEDKDDDAMPNGLIDGTEKGLEGVEVFVCKNNVENEEDKTKILDVNGNIITQPIITDIDGYWETPEIKLEDDGNFAKDYYVEFVYDGQTYEPTTYLATSGGNASTYMSSTTSGRDAYAKDSMALDIDREAVNERLSEIQGKMARSSTGETIGQTSNNVELYYKDVYTPNSRKVSVLETTYNSTQTGRKAVYNVFKAKASTQNDSGNLSYPFDNKVKLASSDITITPQGLKTGRTFKAAYNYCLHINLGLAKRREADLSISKDLLSAKIVINEELQEKTFNSLADIIKKEENKPYEASIKNRSEFKLGLYNTDYYYRAEMYKSDYKAYAAITNLYADLGTGETISDKDLEVYLNYVITIRNDSSTKYKAKVKEINDYFDSSFGSPINEEIWKTINNGTERKNTLIANPSYYQINGKLITNADGVIQDESRIIKDWDIKERNVNSSDGLTYNKMSTSSIKDVAIESGEFIDIYVSFKVSKAKYNEVYESLMLGNKSNIAEISKYSIYNKNTDAIEGKVDKDSAPDNINMALNYYDSYEDDTDSSPVLKLYLEEDVREISGKAWEDRKTNNVGEIENDEALIGGLTTQLVQKITYNDINYDFVWPTDEPLDILGGKRLKDLTGFDSTIETAREKEGTQEVGSYKFKGIPSGKYAVRFIYGDNKINPAEALNSEGENFYMKNGGEENKILTANYNKYLLGNTPAVYNGQDYKTTIYQKGKGTLNNRELGLELNEGVVKLTEDVSSLSSARDSEARRLQVMAESETIMNTLGEILATANERYADHTKLYEKTNMFADTAILDFTGLESLQTKGSQKDKSTRAEIAGLNIGLIERPENAIVLDKEIKEIRIITNDGKIIFDAQYDVNYKVESSIDESKVVLGKVDGGYLVADVKLSNQSINTEVLQSINKAEQKLNDVENKGLQNFRYINVDSDILQGATIEIDYVMTAINIGENDYINKDLATVFTNGDSISSEMLKLAKAKAEKEAKADGSLDFGENIGNFYYTGNKGANDEIVTTRIRQLIDYVDSDAVFLQEKNNSENHKWRGTSSTELQGNGKKASILIGNSAIPLITVLDKNSIEYITNSSNNVVLSGDSTGEYNKDITENVNAGFQASLKPYDSLEGDKDKLPEENESMAQIELTVSKVISAQEDTNNLEFDNLAEIVKYENSAGRRDVVTIPGNASPKGSVEVVGAKKVVNEGEFAGALLERDTSATEVITFTPPTGQEVQIVLATEVLIMALISLTLIVIGIVIIKNRVIKRTV